MKKIVLFGTAINAILLLETDGFNKNVDIIACIDNSKDRIGKEFHGKKIIHPERIVDLEYDYVLVTSRTNYIEMGNQLISYGVPASKIIISYARGHKEFFEKVLGGNRKQVLSREHNDSGKRSNYLEVSHDLINNNVVLEIPIELIRINSVGEERAENLHEFVTDLANGDSVDRQIFRSKYYNELFEFLNNERNEYPENYFMLMGIEGELQKNSTILMRKEFYDSQMEVFQKGISYYKEHSEPIFVKYNRENGFFYIIDGLHRATFLYHKGIRFVPAMMSNDDYESFINRSKIEKVLDVLERERISNIYTPILHPSFYKEYSVTLRDVTYPTRIDLIFKALRDYSLRGKEIIDIGCSSGYNSRMFAREGANVTALEMDGGRFSLASAISELENTKVNYLNKKFEELEIDHKYDIAILMTVLYWYIDTPDILNIFFEKINSMVTEMIIWESGDQKDLEKELIIKNTKFKRYEKLGVTHGTGKVRELGIFML